MGDYVSSGGACSELSDGYNEISDGYNEISKGHNDIIQVIPNLA
jgi:hypothetical protein